MCARQSGAVLLVVCVPAHEHGNAGVGQSILGLIILRRGALCTALFCRVGMALRWCCSTTAVCRLVSSTDPASCCCCCCCFSASVLSFFRSFFFFLAQAANVGTIVTDTLVVAHGMGNLIVANALATGACSLDANTAFYVELQASPGPGRLGNFASEFCAQYSNGSPEWAHELQRLTHMCVSADSSSVSPAWASLVRTTACGVGVGVGEEGGAVLLSPNCSHRSAGACHRCTRVGLMCAGIRLRGPLGCRGGRSKQPRICHDMWHPWPWVDGEPDHGRVVCCRGWCGRPCRRCALVSVLEVRARQLLAVAARDPHVCCPSQHF